MLRNRWFFGPWGRGILYILTLFLGIPLFFAYRISHINPREVTPTFAQNKNPLPFPAQLITFMADDGIRIRGWFSTSNSNKRMIIIVHGYGLSHREMIKRGNGIFPKAADVCFLDLRNHGLSDNSFTTFGFREALDVQTAISRFRSHYDEIIIWGMSMGAAASVRAIMLGSSADMLILEGLYDDLSKAIALQAKHYYIPKFPIVSLGLFFYQYISGVDLDQMDMAANLKKMKDMPILLVHSRADQEVPMSSFNRLKGSVGAHGKTLLLNKGNHEYIYEANIGKYRKRVLDFIVNRK